MTFSVPGRCSALRADTIMPFLQRPGKLLAAWVLSGILVIFIPVIHWNRKKDEYFKAYGYAIEYENEHSGDENSSYYPSCSWYQWRCRQKQYKYLAANGSGEDNGTDLPTWYRFLGGLTEDERHVKEELNVDDTSVALKFVYKWTLVMFISMIAYGAFILCKQRSIGRIVLIMAIFGQFSLLNLIVLVQGVILTNDQDLENEIYGWYGQLSVLMAFTDFLYILFCIIFSLVFVVQACCKGNNSSAFNIKNSNSVDFTAVVSPRRKAKDPHAWNEAKRKEPYFEYKSAAELNMV